MAPQIQQSSAHAQNTHEKCNEPERARGDSLSIPSAHQWSFHFLIPSSLQMRHRLSVDLSCLNSSYNCLCCVLGKAGVQSKYFQAERGSGMARRSAHVIGLKTFFFKFSWEIGKKGLIKLKGLPHFWKMRHVCALSLLHSRRRKKEGSNGERLRDWLCLRRPCPLVSQIALTVYITFGLAQSLRPM